jgi:prepilin-type N-terminal cleavage/methylation domain-containing protein
MVLTERIRETHLLREIQTKERKETIHMENKQDKGFTLVELLIVIVILGILATVTVFAVRGITERSQDNACDVEQRALATAVEAFYVDSGTQTYPASLAALAPTFVKEAPEAGVWTYSQADGSVVGTAGAKCEGF